MKVLAYEVDQYGYIKESYVVDEKETLENETDLIYVKIQNGLYKPKWNGNWWVEGATQTEIEELTKPQLIAPTLEQRIAELENTILDLLEVL